MSWGPDYATLAELKELLGVTDTADDTRLGGVLTAASRAVDAATHRQFGLVDAVEARRYTACWDREMLAWIIPIDDLMTTTGLVVEFDLDADLTFSTSITAAMVDPQPVNAAQRGFPWTELVVIGATATAAPNAVEGATRITGRWGWSSVPTTIREATLLQASRFAARRHAPFGVAGSPEIGSEVRLLDRLDVDVEVMVRRYARRWAAAG